MLEQCWGVFWILCSTALAAGTAGAVFSDTPRTRIKVKVPGFNDTI